MAIAFDTFSDGTSGTATSITWTHTTAGTDRILFVGALGHSDGTDNITGATYNSVAMTLSTKSKGNLDRYIYLFYLKNPASGANSVVVSASSSTEIYGVSTSYTGALQTGGMDASVSTTGTGTSLTSTLTTVADNCWTVLSGWGSGVAPTAGTGSTARTAGIPRLFDNNAAITPAGSTSMTINLSSSVAVTTQMASFAPAPTATSGKNFLAFM